MGKHGQRILAFQTLYAHALAPATDVEQLGALYTHALQCQEEGSALKNMNFTRPQGHGWELALGTWQKEKPLNDLIERLASRPLEDIGRIEQVLLRLGLYEIIYRYTPPKVVMSESMILADEFAAGPGGKFVNGVLDAATRHLTSIREEAQA